MNKPQALTVISLCLFLTLCMVEPKDPECQFLEAKAQSIREAQGGKFSSAEPFDASRKLLMAK